MAKYFKTNSVIVRRFELKDLKQAHSNLFETDNIEEAKMNIRSAINEYYTDEPIWAVEGKTNKSLVGSIRVSNYSLKNKTCNVSWIMSYKHWDNNFMKDALTQILNFLFTKKDIELVECSYYEQDSNTNVILEEIGMTKEATLRDRRVNEKTNKKENFLIYSISKQEFIENRSGEQIQSRFRRFLNKKTS